MCWHSSILSWLAHAALGAFVLLALGCLAVRCCRQPVRRLRLAELTLLACLLAPWLHHLPGLPIIALGWLDTGQNRAAAPSSEVDSISLPVGVAPTISSSAGPEHRSEPAPVKDRADGPGFAAGFDPKPPAEGPQEVGGGRPSLAWLLVPAYLGLTGAFGLWWLVGNLKLRQLCCTARPAPAEVAARFAEIAGPAGRHVRLWMSSQLDVPILYGWRRPVILLPAELCRGKEAAGLRFCLAHEWAHIEQQDMVGWHLALLAQVLFFYQPLFWWLRRQVRLCQDFLADAQAAEHAGAEDYADYLLLLARRRLVAPTTAALGIADHGSNLYRRILMLVTRRQPLERRCHRLWTAAAALSTVLLLLAVSAIRLDVRAEDRQTASREVAAGQAIACSGRVFDRATGMGIEGARVTVRRSIYADHLGTRVLQETRHRTDTSGKYRFGILPEQAAERYLYIELDVEAPGYAPRNKFGYAYSMIQKNEQVGGRPFFENVDLRAAREISGVVETPDGKPAAGVKVLAYSNTDRPDGFEYGSFADGKTDANGRFRLPLITPGPAVFWLLPRDFAPSTHVLQDVRKRGDLGRCPLQPGISFKATVLDAEGRPAAGIWVVAEKRGGIESFMLPVADHLRRRGLTDSRGEVTLGPLPPGRYEVMPQELAWDPTSDEQRPMKRPLPGVYVRTPLTLQTGKKPESLTLRAVPHVVIEAQYYDSKGKPTPGHAGHLFGRMDRDHYWFVQASMDETGKMTLLAPRGLTEARLSLLTNEHGALRYRLRNGQPLRATREIDLGTLDHDVKGIEIIRYAAPLLVVAARDQAGAPIKDFRVKITYPPDARRRKPGERFVNDVQGDVFQEKQEDGRWRAGQLLPDEEITVTVSARGYQAHTERLKLAEGTFRELALVLEKK